MAAEIARQSGRQFLSPDGRQRRTFLSGSMLPPEIPAASMEHSQYGWSFQPCSIQNSKAWAR